MWNGMDLQGDDPLETNEANITLIKESGTNGGVIWIPRPVKNRNHRYSDAALVFPFSPIDETRIDDRRTIRTYSMEDIPDGTYAANTVSGTTGEPYKVIFTVEDGRIVQTVRVISESSLHRQQRVSGYRRSGKRTMTLVQLSSMNIGCLGYRPLGTDGPGERVVGVGVRDRPVDKG